MFLFSGYLLCNFEPRAFKMGEIFEKDIKTEGSKEMLDAPNSSVVISEMKLHALWYIRVFGSNPVLENKGIFGVFEYSIPLHPPL